MRKIRHEDHLIQIDTYRIPVKIYREPRRSVRLSIGKAHAILRVPVFGLRSVEQNLELMRAWLQKKVLIQPRYQKLFTPIDYSTPFTLHIMDRVLRVSLVQDSIKNVTGKLKGDEIIIRYPIGFQVKDNTHKIKSLLSRLCAKEFKPRIEARVQFWNQRFFKEEINKIQLKYNSSNWGSCSAKRNLNFSTRLLFTPAEVIDYVIVHELAHLKELNHSARFWQIVAKVIPDYKSHETWLKENGHACDF